MTSGLAWLNELMVWLGRWFPRLVLIKATHLGVRFGRHGDIRTLGPGLFCYWPITTEVELVSIRERTTEIAGLLCGREIVALALQYTIRDPAEALRSLNDVFAMLDDRAQAAIAAAYQPTVPNAGLEAVVVAQLAKEFASKGIDIHAVTVLQRGRVIPVKNLNDWATHSKSELA